MTKQPNTPKFKRMYRNKITYTFTINFEDDFQSFDQPLVHRLHFIMKRIDPFFKKLHKVATFTLYPEFSTPDQKTQYKLLKRRDILNICEPSGPRFHYHGTVRFHDVGTFYLKYYQKLLHYGLFEIDTIQDPKIWNDYITKDKEVMKPLMEYYHYDYIQCNPKSKE